MLRDRGREGLRKSSKGEVLRDIKSKQPKERSARRGRSGSTERGKDERLVSQRKRTGCNWVKRRRQQRRRRKRRMVGARLRGLQCILIIATKTSGSSHLAAFKVTRIAITTALASSKSGRVLKLSVLHPEAARIHLFFLFFFFLDDMEHRDAMFFARARNFDSFSLD